jgi:hypothetical protein
VERTGSYRIGPNNRLVSPHSIESQDYYSPDEIKWELPKRSESRSRSVETWRPSAVHRPARATGFSAAVLSAAGGAPIAGWCAWAQGKPHAEAKEGASDD